ncbi:DUF1684 domain-containing protein [Cyclonatronum proteinivorum]|nr:DUF1684 domain-containing protein [Cyclonatronum proteinivorum]
MSIVRSGFLAAVAALFFAACTAEPTHEEEVNAWHADRIERLSAERGWLKLAGLFWLNDGTHTFGTDTGNDIVLPENSILPFAGSVTVEGNMITLSPAEDGLFMVSGEALHGSLTFPSENPVEAEHGRLAFTFIERGGTIGLRLYDQESYVYTGFTGIERFDVQPQYKVEARLIPHEAPASLPILNVLGQVTDTNSPGVLHFELKGESHTLWALGEENDEQLFLTVADETNRDDTFGGGRFLYVPNPGPNGTVMVDFNKLYNPPCALSEYTTCPLPPPENRLPLRIEAGEKRYHASF